MKVAVGSPLTVVTLTPIPVRSDSRTFKQAASVARLGYRSIVVEGPDSGLDVQGLPFELIATADPVAPAAAQPAASPPVDAHGAAASDATQVEASEAGNMDAAPTPDAGALPPVRHPEGDAGYDGFRKSVRAWVGGLPGGAALQRLLWLIEYKFKTFLFLLRTDRIKALKMLLYWPCYIVYFRPRLFFVLLYNKIVYSNYSNLIIYKKNYYKKFLFSNFRKIPSANLYYVHSFYQYPAVYLRCLINKSVYIYDAHDFYSEMDAETGVSPYWRHWIMPFHLKIERSCVRNAAAVVTVNEGIAALMKAKFGCDALVLRNSHDPRLETPVQRGIRDVIGLPAEARLVVCVGQWKPDTAITEAMEAFARVPEHCHLAFLGAGFPSYDDAIRRLGLAGRVHFLPAVKSTEVVPFIRSADLGLLLYHPVSPSIRNCLPNGFFQPLAAGLPILYPRLPEIERLATRHDVGLAINPLDPASIADGVLALCGDDALRARKRENVLNAREQLSWERDEEQLKILIEGLIGPPVAA